MKKAQDLEEYEAVPAGSRLTVSIAGEPALFDAVFQLMDGQTLLSVKESLLIKGWTSEPLPPDIRMVAIIELTFIKTTKVQIECGVTTPGGSQLRHVQWKVSGDNGDMRHRFLSLKTLQP